MPFILSPPIVINSDVMWFEGPVYEKENIYSIEPGKMPPVNYDVHKIKSHSLTHAESASHVEKLGKTVDQYFANPSYFYGKCLVLKLKGNNYKLIDENKKIYQWIVSKAEIVDAIERIGPRAHNGVEKVLVSTEFYPLNGQGFHDPNYVLTLSEEAANFLVSNSNFNMYGTSWKSSDYNPGKMERPIHKILFQKAIIFELLDLKPVPEGEYFFVGLPLRISGASESPVTPILFTFNELK